MIGEEKLADINTRFLEKYYQKAQSVKMDWSKFNLGI